MKSTFSIIFYLKRQVVKKDGTVPVMGRITVDGTQAQFSCKTTANPDLWDTKGGRMIGKSMQALEVNRKLDKMRVSISKHYQEIMDRDNFVTADKVKNAFLGLEYRCHTLMKVYSQSRDEIEKIRNQISIIFRCTGREYLEGTNHPFSFVLTIEQKHSAELDGNSLYDGLFQ